MELELLKLWHNNIALKKIFHSPFVVLFFPALSLTRILFQIDWLCLFKGELITSTCYLIIIAMGKCFTTKQPSLYNYLKLVHNDFKL